MNLQITTEKTSWSQRPELSLKEPARRSSLQGAQNNLAAAKLTSYRARLSHSVKKVVSSAPARPKRELSVAEKATQIRRLIKVGDLEGTSLAVATLLTFLADSTQAEAKELLRKLDSNRALSVLASNLGEAAIEVDGKLTAFGPKNPKQAAFDRIVVGLSKAVSLVADKAITKRLGDIIAARIGSNIGRFDESFELAVTGGQGAALAGAVAKAVARKGERNSAGHIVEGIERGSKTFQTKFDTAADKVDKANRDLFYLIAQWGPMYGDTEEGKKALQARIEEFKNNHPEYEELDRLSTNIGSDLEVLHDLQSLFPEKQNLKDRERDWLKEIPRFGATENGRRSLADAVERSAHGGSFLDRLEGAEFNGVRQEAGQQALTAGLARLVEAVQSGDRGSLQAASDGLIHSHDLFGESEAAMTEVVGDLKAISNASLSVAASAANSMDRAAGNLLDSIERLIKNPVTATKLKTAGGIIGAIAGGINFSEDPKNWQSAIAPLEALFDIGEARASFKGGKLFKALGNTANALNAFGIAIDGYGAIKALDKGDLVGAGISATGVVGGLVTMTATTGATLGVGLALGVGSAIAGLIRAHHKKVEASNHFESTEAQRFIRGALEEAGVSDGHIDKVVGHFSNADDEGRQVGILIAQAAERAGITPKKLIQLIGKLKPSQVLDIVEAGHGVDPTGDSLHDLPQSDPERDQYVGTTPQRNGRYTNRRDTRPRTVEGFLLYLERVHGLRVRFRDPRTL